MYLDYYGFKLKPFDLVPDPRFLYISKEHDMALSHLEYGIMDNKGLICLTGEVGAGKTILVHHLLRNVDHGINTALVVNPVLDPAEFVLLVARQLGVQTESTQKALIYGKLHSYLLEQFRLGHRTVLVIDEAQNLPNETLEEVRMLSNLQTEESHLVQVILVGQPELKQRLSAPDLVQLSQRISVFFHLKPLEAEETASYIAHRLAVAGHASSDPLFTEQSVRKVHDFSGGIPRMINSVCDAALLYGYGEEARVLDEDLIDRVIRDRVADTSGVRGTSAVPPPSDTGLRKPVGTGSFSPDMRSSDIQALFVHLGELMGLARESAELLRSTPQRIQSLLQEELRDPGGPLQKLKEVLGLFIREYKEMHTRNRALTKDLDRLSRNHARLKRMYQEVLNGKAAQAELDVLDPERRVRDSVRVRSLLNHCRRLVEENKELRAHVRSNGESDTESQD